MPEWTVQFSQRHDFVPPPYDHELWEREPQNRAGFMHGELAVQWELRLPDGLRRQSEYELGQRAAWEQAGGIVDQIPVH